jgi:hypothetical protein
LQVSHAETGIAKIGPEQNGLAQVDPGEVTIPQIKAPETVLAAKLMPMEGYLTLLFGGQRSGRGYGRQSPSKIRDLFLQSRSRIIIVVRSMAIIATGVVVFGQGEEGVHENLLLGIGEQFVYYVSCAHVSSQLIVDRPKVGDIVA